MKKNILIVAAILVLMVPAAVWADSPGPSFTLDYTASITMGGSYWGYSGGPFYSILDGKPDVPAYCVEETVYFYPGTTYKADLYKDTPIGDNSSDWFYFASYDINTFGLDKSNRLDQIATQYAVWAWAGQFGAITDWNLVPVEFRTRAEDIYNADAIAAAWDDAGYRYADLYTLDAQGKPIDAQDQIVPVPEPMTLLLLGLGLIGVAGIRRKFKG